MLRLSLAVAIALVPLLASAEDCAFHAERSVTVDAKGFDGLKLDTGAGDLVIEGVPDLERIEVSGKACASEQAALDAIKFEQQRDGAKAVIATSIPNEGENWSLLGNHYAYMDVTVRMPARLALSLRDSSGDLEASKIDGNIDLMDSSGDIRLHDLGGNVEVSDTSGDIGIHGVAGKVTILSDSSGDIDIGDVKGDAIVHQDSSGDIDFNRIGGNASVDRDSSGDIDFRDIGKDASVGSDGSGDIEADGVHANFSVAHKAGNGDNIRYRNVAGKVTLPPAD